MHRFGASLNRHVHFHCGVLDGVFEGGSGSDGLVQFRPASACGLRARAAVAAPVRGRVLRWFARRGPIERDDVREVLPWETTGFSLDASAPNP